MKPTPLVKICGITNVSDAHTSIKLGADFLGCVFAEASPRICSLQTAQEIKKLSTTKKVIVFGYDSFAYIDSIFQHFVLDPSFYIQVPKDYQHFNKIIQAYSKNKVIPVVHVESKNTLLNTIFFKEYPYIILDSKKITTNGEIIAGGTGKTFNWEYLTGIKENFLLAGGLNHQNIKVALNNVPHAYGFDVSSGIEETIGQKSIPKLTQFIEAIKNTQISSY